MKHNLGRCLSREPSKVVFVSLITKGKFALRHPCPSPSSCRECSHHVTGSRSDLVITYSKTCWQSLRLAGMVAHACSVSTQGTKAQRVKGLMQTSVYDMLLHS